MKSVTNMLTHQSKRKNLFIAFLILFFLGSFAAAQIGASPEDNLAQLEQYEPTPTQDGYVAVGTEFEFSIIDGSVLSITGSGPLGEPQLRFIGSLMSVGTGYGSDLATPVANYLRQQQDEFFGQGPILVEVGDFYMVVDIYDNGNGTVADYALIVQSIDTRSFREARHSIGADDAAYVIRVYSDFECPYCAMFEQQGMPIVRGLLDDRDDVRFEYHHFPLRSHPNAALVAEASECVATLTGEDNFWAFHDLVFQNQTAWAGSSNALPILLDYAHDIGADHPALRSCIINGDEAQEVAESYNHAISEIQVTGTPTIYVNGVRLSDYSSTEAFERAMRIAELLNLSAETP